MALAIFFLILEFHKISKMQKFNIKNLQVSTPAIGYLVDINLAKIKIIIDLNLISKKIQYPQKSSRVQKSSQDQIKKL